MRLTLILRMENFPTAINTSDIDPVEGPEGILRRSLAYSKDALLCTFTMKKGATIPLHNHIHGQIGYVIKGKLQFLTEKGGFIAQTGDSYVFNSEEKHGAEVLEDSEVIEVFTPCRDEYLPKS